MLIEITNGAHAQTRRKVTLEASVPFQFIVGNRTLPAGRYVFEMATGSPKATDRAGVLIVRGHEQGLFAAVAADVTAEGNPHIEPKLVFMRNGGRTFLSRVWRQGNTAGLSVPVVPTTEGRDSVESEVLTLKAKSINGGM
jgi:hypothetical protein